MPASGGNISPSISHCWPIADIGKLGLIGPGSALLHARVCYTTYTIYYAYRLQVKQAHVVPPDHVHSSCNSSPAHSCPARDVTTKHEQARGELGAAEAARAQLAAVQAALAELEAGLPRAVGAAEASAAVRHVAAELQELHRCALEARQEHL